MFSPTYSQFLIQMGLELQKRSLLIIQCSLVICGISTEPIYRELRGPLVLVNIQNFRIQSSPSVVSSLRFTIITGSQTKISFHVYYLLPNTCTYQSQSQNQTKVFRSPPISHFPKLQITQTSIFYRKLIFFMSYRVHVTSKQKIRSDIKQTGSFK